MGVLGQIGGALGGKANATLGKLAASAANGGGIGTGLKQALAEITSMLGSLPSPMPGQAPKPLPGIGSGAIEKMLYMAALNGAIKKAGDSAHFNLETHINDLWIKLSQIRQGQPDALKLQELVGKQQDFTKALQGILQKMHTVSASVGQALK